MATLVLSAIGTMIGGPVGGSIGALLGRTIDSKLFGGGGREGPRLTELKLTTSSYGAPIPRHFGRMRVPGQIIWATDLVEHKDKQGGGKSGPSVTSYTYSASFAVALSSRPIRAIGRIWADGKLLRGAAGDLKVGGTFRFHDGAGDQAIDPLIAAAESAGQCPAYRGTAYAVFEDLQLSDYGNRIPSLSFEVIADDGELSLSDLLADVVADFAAPVALSGIAGLSNEGSLGEVLSSLEPFYPVDCDACGDLLELRPDIRETPPILLPDAATSTNREDFGGNQGFSRKRGGASEAPVAVLRYYDVDRDYQPGAQRAAGRPMPGQPRTIELPAALDAGSARLAVERAGRRVSWGRQAISWRVTQLDPAVRPGQTVSLPEHPGEWRIRDWEWREHGVDLTLARLSPLDQANTTPADPGRALPPADQQLSPTLLAAVELPWDGNPGTATPQTLALASSAGTGWSGASLFVDHGDGGLDFVGTTGRTRAVIGSAVTALSAASPLLFDRHSTVVVQLASTDLLLPNATLRQVSMGANKAVLGAEIIQFTQAELIGEGRWMVSGLLRGRAGTEAAVMGHATGEAFALLDGSGTVLSPDLLGNVPSTAIVAVGLADTTPVTAPIMLRGIGLRPPSPVHPRWAKAADGTDRLAWTRRARGGWSWLDAVDVPLNEQTETYAIEFGGPDTPVARWETQMPVLVLAAGLIAALKAQSPSGRFSIRQRGDRALSEPLVCNPPQS